MGKQRSNSIRRPRFQFDPKAIRITTNEIRADLEYPAPAPRDTRTR